MQKKIIALAVAGLVSGVAFAQSNVTVYGVADVGYTYSASNTGLPAGDKYVFSGLRDGVDNGLNGSRVGFKGEEGLGNGLKALFLIEMRVNVSTGDQTNQTRQSFVGLNSASLGTLTLGRQYNVAADIYGNNNSNGIVSTMPVNLLINQTGSQIGSQGGNERQSNMIKYMSPTFSGFTGRINYVFSDTTGATSTGYNAASNPTENGKWALSADYTNGPFNVDVAYARTSKARLTSATNVGTYGGGGLNATPVAWVNTEGNNIDEWYIGGAYDFKVVKAFATYQTLHNKNNAVLAATNSKLWALGASVPVGNGKVMVEYANIGFKQDNNPGVKQDGHDSAWGLGYQYDLSKRTTLYSFVSSAKYDTNTSTTTGTAAGFPGAGGGGGFGTAVAGQTQTNLSVGVRHFF